MRLLLTILSSLFAGIQLHAGNNEVWLNPQRGFIWNEATDTCGIIINTTDTTLIRSANIQTGTAPFSIATTVSNLHCNPERSYPYRTSQRNRYAVMPAYSVLLIGSDTISVKVTTDTRGAEPFISLAPRLSVSAPGIHSEFNPKGEYKVNQPACLIIRREGTTLTIDAGTAEIERQWSGNLPEDFSIDKVGIAVSPGGAVDVKYLHAEAAGAIPDKSSILSLKEITGAIETTGDPYAGYWVMTARTTEEKQLRMGGDYTLALVPHSPGFYHLYYIAGATVNPGRWTPGQLKATINRRKHPRYDAMWIDAECEPMTDATAFFTDDGMLEIRFPYYDGASLTLQRLPISAIPSLLPEDDTDP